MNEVAIKNRNVDKLAKTKKKQTKKNKKKKTKKKTDVSRPTLVIFLFPLTRPCFFLCIGRLVEFFCLISQISYPLYFVVNYNETTKPDCTNAAKLNIFYARIAKKVMDNFTSIT